jgi:hypothetical protein
MTVMQLCGIGTHSRWVVEMGDYERQYEGEWKQRGFTHFETNFANEGFIQIPKTAPTGAW